MHSKQKEIFEELASNKMEEIQDLSKQIDFNNLTYRYKGNNDQKLFLQVLNDDWVLIKI